MGSESSLKVGASGLSTLRFAGLFLPPGQFATTILQFPSTNCVGRFGREGRFCIDFTVYQEGQKRFTVYSYEVNAEGSLEVDFGWSNRFLPDQYSLMLVDYHHAPEVPVDFYVAHIHKSTGTYVAYPGAAFIGDQLFPEVHAQQLENTLFWPAITENEVSRTSIAVVNPYKISFAYQVSLFTRGKLLAQTETQRVAPFRVVRHFMDELFPGVPIVDGEVSLCIGAQYKLVAYIIISNRSQSIISTIDHLHAYCLY